MTPTDTLYGSQWHFTSLGTRGSELLIQRIWNEYDGNGIHVGVYDEGIQISHPDLDNNYNSALHVVINGLTLSGVNTSGAYPHGTSVAGLIAAENNGSDTVGVAFGADVTGINIFNPNSSIYINSANATVLKNFFNAVRQGTNFDVVNNSWGTSPGFYADGNLNNPNSFAARVVDAYDHISDNGREGLGTVIVQSAGNDSTFSNGDGVNASRFTITVGALRESGGKASYSNWGADLLVSAPGGDYADLGELGIVTTDLTGRSGYNLRSNLGGSYSYTDDFGGTSAAAPIVSGVVALMLDANSSLGWRDVQNILATSADYSYAPNVYSVLNGADNWNGGGMHFGLFDGYGEVNAYAAVRMAEVWTLFSSAETSANEQLATSGVLAPQLALPQTGTVTYQFTITDHLDMEHVDLTLGLQHPMFPNMSFTLISPSGTSIVVLRQGLGNPDNATSGLTWTFGVEGFRGEDSFGTWTLSATGDHIGGGQGILNSLELEAFGSTATNNDVFHYTDEFAFMSSNDASRLQLADGNGGTDWIDAAAVTGNLILNLTAGASSTVDGSAFITISNTSIIENAVTGDGNDSITGNDAANVLYGMRGDDTLSGGEGDDTLDGGAGSDSLAGGNGSDTAQFSNVFASYAFSYDDATETYKVYGSDGIIDTVTGVEIFKFADMSKTAAELPVTAGAPVRTVSVSALNSLRGESNSGTVLYSFEVILSGIAFGTQTVSYAVAGTGVNAANSADFTGTLSGLLTFAMGETVKTVTVAVKGDTVAETDESFSLTLSAASAGLALGTVTATATILNDDVPGATVLIGTNGNDGLTGSSGTHVLRGLGGNDVLNGGSGADTMIGGTGDDTYVVDNAGDIVDETAGDGTDTVQSSISFSVSDAAHAKGDIEKLTLTGSSSINGTGNALANVITGNSGNNILAGLGGADFLNGGAGMDTASYATSAEAVNINMITWAVSGGDAAGDTFSGIENVTGTNWDDTIEGNGSTNVLAGGSGIDTVSYEHALAAVNVSLAITSSQATGGAGSDTLSAFENLTGSGFNDTLTGNSGSNVLRGLAGNDILNGGLGADILVGGGGNDTYVVDNSGDVVDEGTGSGIDLVQSAANFSLSTTLGDVENLTLTGSAAINGIGNGLVNTITGNSGANIIEGKDGADILDGGAGLDTVSYASSAAAVTIVLNGATATFGIGGDAQGDSIKNFENVTGSAYADMLIGNGSANVIDGGAGEDDMNGGAGNDTYVVDDALDVITEALAGGTDLVRSFIDYSLLATNLENLTLVGVAHIDATGNSLANILTGNAGNNRLDGGAGIDTMVGGLGDDTYVVDVATDKVTELAGQGTDTIETSLATFSLAALTAVDNLTYTGIANFTGTGNALANRIAGGTGNDVLNGGTGADTLVGGGGNDTYVVDNVGDAVDETGGSGTDLVQSSVSFNLSLASGEVEKLSLTGSGAVNGTGNGLVNTITGNSGANIIEGKGGADILDGGLGIDTVSYAASASGVTVALNGSTATFGIGGDADGDSIKNFENVTGSALADFLTGNGSANVINGGGGNDILAGGAGSDSFVFSSLLDPGNIDTITDYSAPNDTLRLDDAIFSTLAAGTLSAAAFRIGSAAADASDRIIYDAATGAVYYDNDGLGGNAAQQFATLSIGLSLTNSDFFVF